MLNIKNRSLYAYKHNPNGKWAHVFNQPNECASNFPIKKENRLCTLLI
jgi:hypothetical protein